VSGRHVDEFEIRPVHHERRAADPVAGQRRRAYHEALERGATAREATVQAVKVNRVAARDVELKAILAARLRSG